ncbi:dihydroorotate dehydrogenase (quinone) mitochondrial-like isoform X1 [Biomphalaria pfeifferi]|uniref:Dihydroorotate dehydrogenase (quinone), mitochondrial n=1 Tax=Biomphalaria pfeifferi TaxID=112525 RepID=A0AAD8BB08_BIOPF|nr:dihydroorotate dehydrogenase (quinone) mitochondrial-like isoform X1 [Biomphalaria pfeifferi]
MNAAANGSKFWVQLKEAGVIVNGGIILFGGINLYRGNEKFYEEIAMPLLRIFSPETAHNISIKLIKCKLVPKPQTPDPPSLKTQVWGRTFQSMIGLAAGYDKQGEAVDGLFKMGFGFVEVGSVTPEPQPGNPKPRVFRLTEDKAVINRYGFNSEGHDAVYKRLYARNVEQTPTGYPQTYLGEERNMLNIGFWTPVEDNFSKLLERQWIKVVKGNKHFKRKDNGVLGVNLGKNKQTENAVEDYVKGVKKFGPIADYLVINVSSPNTPGLRDMQRQEELSRLLEKVVEERNKLTFNPKPPLLIKIAPDLSEEEKKDIADVITRTKSHVDGLIVSNTTVARPDSLVSKNKEEVGGLSGAPLKDKSLETIRDMYRLTNGQVPIVGVGGISNGQDAYSKVKAGASLIQLYTALIYQGPPVISKIKRELDDLLRNDGYSHISEAVGADFKASLQTKNKQ